MKFFKLLWVAALIAIMALIPIQAQTYQTLGMEMYSQDTGTDSATFSHPYYYLIPDGMKLDTTLQLVYYQYSADGTPVTSISYKWGVYFGGKFSDAKMSANETVIDATFETELNSSWGIFLHASDVCINYATVGTAYNMLCVTIAGAALNESDTEYGFIVRGTPLYENTKDKQRSRKLLY